ncbi:hypothetical protein MKK65_10615 [Methylobacterium sp. J-001]|uniref:hypothetical protein n=1 Tax=Methylobacterium sp. J-001 TaxID=2836609 RepID=UPI001FBBAB1D|nr:hypothetical protein [Methylobacterium sp. J-001]MCJ2117016.1 hypothetical protein [Methylobacterium sp. J-001]
MLDLATATRDYARSIDAGTFAATRDRDLAPWFEAMGPEIWAWQYARRLTDQAAWRARPGADERRERTVAHLDMTKDIETWERALARLDAIAARAQALGDRRPDPIALPSEVRAAIEERRRAALERVARRHAREGGSGGPAPVPAEVRPVPPPPGPTLTAGSPRSLTKVHP